MSTTPARIAIRLDPGVASVLVAIIAAISGIACVVLDRTDNLPSFLPWLGRDALDRGADAEIERLRKELSGALREGNDLREHAELVESQNKNLREKVDQLLGQLALVPEENDCGRPPKDRPPTRTEYLFDQQSDSLGWSVSSGKLEARLDGGYGGGPRNGYLYHNAPGDKKTSYIVAPPDILGDWTNVSSLSLVMKSRGGKDFNSGYGYIGDIVIRSGAMEAVAALPSRPGQQWTPYKIFLEDSLWVTDREYSLSDLLPNVTYLGIRAEFGVGPDNSSLDEIRLDIK